MQNRLPFRSSGHDKVAELLISKGANTNVVGGEKNNSALILAAADGKIRNQLIYSFSISIRFCIKNKEIYNVNSMTQDMRML